MEQIFDLALIKAHAVLKVITGREHIFYCIVDYCNPDDKVVGPWLGEDVKKEREESAHYSIKVYEFNEHSTSWSMTLPKESNGFFISPSDECFSFKFFTSSLKEVKMIMKEQDNQRIAGIFQDAVNKVSKINSEKFINASLQKLVMKDEDE